MLVQFTQYHRPDGKTTQEFTLIKDSLHEKVTKIQINRFFFTAELMPDNLVAISISDNDQDYAYKVAVNNQHLRLVIEELISKFNLEYALAKREKYRAEMQQGGQS